MHARFNAQSVSMLSRSLRRTAPELRRDMDASLRGVVAPIAAEIKEAISGLPFKGGEKPKKGGASEAAAGVRTTVLARRGAGVRIGGGSAPGSWAKAFTVGNRGEGQFVSPVFGKWRTGKPIQRSHPEAVFGPWERGKVRARAAAEAVLDRTIERIVSDRG